ncbi:hypothetical protein CH063_02089, partial [Colletotrichum higginsianum]
SRGRPGAPRDVAGPATTEKPAFRAAPRRPRGRRSARRRWRERSLRTSRPVFRCRRGRTSTPRRMTRTRI